jgi:hypothetical protein
VHRRSIALAVAVALLLLGCSSNNHGYTSATETAFMAACQAGQTGSEPICRCAYDEIVRQIPFDTYVDYDRRIRKDPKDVPPDIVRIVADCGSRPGISSSSS